MQTAESDGLAEATEHRATACPWWAKQTLGKEVPNPPNIILGHEFVGVVDEVVDDRDAELLGQRVGVNTFITCGRCSFCQSGRAIECLATGKVQVDPLITHRFALTRALEAFETACNKSRTGAIKIILDCQS